MGKNTTARTMLNRYVNGVVCSGRADHKTAVKWGRKWLATMRTADGRMVADVVRELCGTMPVKPDAAERKG